MLDHLNGAETSWSTYYFLIWQYRLGKANINLPVFHGSGILNKLFWLGKQLQLRGVESVLSSITQSMSGESQPLISCSGVIFGHANASRVVFPSIQTLGQASM